ncbi:3-hydroxyacyl-CoA dehydrogenase NAD-binding domain-containing protein [Paraburkholderia adhaesiva]|uniref:3-hydroxyacyl-CoA dehydrogenase NAD-binding domain-containing protein n=1 Tax=Paraburkholderia adhaesiva TaxID=2883244 RepID=UPI001F41897B|nr:3-hydroxyacyl-CoA dehydrogenase NAD-binding domain-containing protein [Paraburkholderia adhaesiva]
MLPMTTHHYNIETIGIVGAGAMGRGIARIVSQANLAMRQYDAKAQAVAAARNHLADAFIRRAENRIDDGASHAVSARADGVQAPDRPRGRPSPWVTHRAHFGIPLTQPDTTNINKPNEARA